MAEQWIRLMGTPFAIHRSVLDERQAQVNHGQTLDRLNERGGIGIEEAWAISTKQRYGMGRNELAAWDYMLTHAKASQEDTPDAAR